MDNMSVTGIPNNRNQAKKHAETLNKQTATIIFQTYRGLVYMFTLIITYLQSGF